MQTVEACFLSRQIPSACTHSSFVGHIEQYLTSKLSSMLPLECLWDSRFHRAARLLPLRQLEVGLAKPIVLRREVSGRRQGAKPLRCLYLSDLHLHALWSSQLIGQIVEALDGVRADILLLGGDLVEAADQLQVFSELVKLLARRFRVFAVSGNHDRVLEVGTLESAVHAGGGTWLQGHAALVHPGVELFGYVPQKLDGERYSVLVGHDPEVFRSAAQVGFQLVLAGHIHGGQVHLWSWNGRSYPGGFAYRWNGTRFRSGNSELLVSRGLVDFLPLRWCCPREIVYFEI